MSIDVVPLAVLKLCLISFLGFFLYRKKILTEETLEFFTFLVINFTIPFLFFSRLIESQQIVLTHPLWVFIAISLSIFLAGYLLGFVASWSRSQKIRQEFISMVSFQNAGYLPMNLVLFLFPPSVQQKIFVYIFLYLLGFNIIIWSIGSFLIFKKKGERFKFKSILTPPITSTIIALVLVYTDTARFIPKLIIDPIKMIGDTSFVLSMIILGSWLARVKLTTLPQRLLLVIKPSLCKLIILPLLFFAALLHFKIFSLLGTFIMLEAAMPSAVSLPIIAHMRCADNEFISQGVFLTHIFSIVTIPLWLSILKLLGFHFL